MTGYVRIGRVDDVPKLEGRSVTVDGRRIAVFRLADGWAAIDGACPHAGGPLSDGLVAERCVTCPLHGRRFDLHTGQQVNGTDSVDVHEVVERDGELWLRVAQSLPQAA
jgi:nitrite reductase (NADH) small subunit